MGWFREHRALRDAERETVDVAANGLDEPLRVPARALREVTAAAMPALLKHGQVALTIGSPLRHMGAERPAGLMPGSGRPGEPRSLTSSLARGRAFWCPHMSVGNVTSASCGVCGPMHPAA